MGTSALTSYRRTLGSDCTPQAATLVRVAEVCGIGLVALSYHALPGEFELVVERRLFVHDHVQLGEVGVDNSQSV